MSGGEGVKRGVEQVKRSDVVASEISDDLRKTLLIILR